MMKRLAISVGMTVAIAMVPVVVHAQTVIQVHGTIQAGRLPGQHLDLECA